VGSGMARGRLHRMLWDGACGVDGVTASGSGKMVACMEDSMIV
jgi:hypothetical protein